MELTCLCASTTSSTGSNKRHRGTASPAHLFTAQFLASVRLFSQGLSQADSPGPASGPPFPFEVDSQLYTTSQCTCSRARRGFRLAVAIAFMDPFELQHTLPVFFVNASSSTRPVGRTVDSGGGLSFTARIARQPVAF